MNLEVTESAFNRIKEILSNDPKLPSILRVSIEGGGCAGFMYKYEFVNQIEKDDFIINKNDTKVVIDPSSMSFLKDCKLDFIEEMTGSYFQITNPNAATKCGCNNSFSV